MTQRAAASSNRGGYSREFMRELGNCEDCGGSKDYPLLIGEVGEQSLCVSSFHTLWQRLKVAVRGANYSSRKGIPSAKAKESSPCRKVSSLGTCE